MVTAPSSKSHMLRALWIALLARNKSKIFSPLESNDTEDTLRLIKNLGAQYHGQENFLEVDSTQALKTSQEELFSGDSGISTRFILPILGLRKNYHEPVILNCSAQMRARPMSPLIQALNQLGMQIEYLNHQNQLPVRVQGKLIGGETSISGQTSQFISALLMALPCAAKNSLIHAERLQERPYMEMTLSWLKQQGIRFSHENKGFFDYFHIEGNQFYSPFSQRMSGDFSQSSYILAAALLTRGKISIQNLNMDDSQGDKRIIEILKQLGVRIEIKNHQITIEGGAAWGGFNIDANDIPDLVPTLAVLATQATSSSRIYNVPQARIKECDRLHALFESLSLMGAQIKELPDGLMIEPSALYGAELSSCQDHRMVMALSVAGCIAKGKTVIREADCVNKTFPNFFNCMKQLGAKIMFEKM